MKLRHIAALLIAVAAAMTGDVATATAAADPRGTPPPASALPAYQPHGRPAKLVALGDSFTGGLGVFPTILPAANPWAPIGCGQSELSFPRLVASDFGSRYPGEPVQLTDASCKSALTEHVSTTQVATGNRPQLEAVPTDLSETSVDESASVVLLSLGINDTGLVALIAACANYTTTNDANLGSITNPCTANGMFAIDPLLSDVARNIAWNIVDIRRKAPGARIIVVGYLPIMPSLTTASGSALYPCRNSLAVRSGDVVELHKLERRLNAIMRVQAERYGGLPGTDSTRGVQFADPRTQPGVEGHDLCRAPDVRWVEPRTGYVGPSSIRLHPNAAGHEFMRRVVQRHIPKSVW